MSLPIQFISDESDVAAAKRRKRDERAKAMTEAYMNGATLEAIGLDWAMTRERVRQILRDYGVPAGANKIVRFKEEREIARQRVERFSLRDLKKHGMTTESLREISPYARSDVRHPLRVFEGWRTKCKKTGFRFEVRFVDWWRLWEASGKWHDRGRGRGYATARYDSDGPWTLDNLRVIACDERARDPQRGAKISATLRKRGAAQRALG